MLEGEGTNGRRIETVPCVFKSPWEEAQVDASFMLEH